MILDVPFVYSVAYVPKGRRISQHTDAPASVGVDVASVEGKLAFEIGCPFVERHENIPDRYSPFHAAPGETVRVYRAQDAYWVEICGAGEAQARLAERHAMTRDPFAVHGIASAEALIENESPDPKRRKFRTREELEREHVSLRSWDESGRDRVAAMMMRRAAEDLREIDGRLCMRVSEPVLDAIHVSAPKPDGETSFRDARTWIGDRLAAPGRHVVVAQLSSSTPAGFTLQWDLGTLKDQRWRIDQLDAAVAFARADEERAHGPDDDARGTAVPPRPEDLLQPPAVTVAFADVSACKHEGLSSILRAEIDHLRSNLVQNAPSLDREMLTAALDLQHAFERDGGRLTPAVIAAARRALALHDEGHGKAERLDRIVLDVLGVHSYDTYGRSISRLAPPMEALRLALSYWDTRDQAACEWTDRLLPVAVASGTDYDVAEVATLQRGQDLVDVGCDPAVLAAVAAVPEGGVHVVAAETVEGKLLGFAALLRETSGGLEIDRIFAPRAPNPRKLADATARFEAFVAANLEAAAENDALMGMTL